LKLTNIEKACPVCAQLFKTAQNLRNDLLITNLSETQKLLHTDFVKSGKTWEVFIKDYEAHHIIPVNLLEKSPALQFYYNNGGKLNFNSLENGIMVKKVNLDGVHANHPVYTTIIGRKIRFRLEKIMQMNVSATRKNQLMDIELKQIIEETRMLILEKSVKSNVKINKLLQ